MKILNMPPPSDGMATMDNNGTFEQGTDWVAWVSLCQFAID